MGEERVRCITLGCENTILPATVARTGGYCGPCDGKRRKAERDQYIHANRKDVDLFAGMTDPVQILWTMHAPRKPDPLVRLLPPPRTAEQLFGELDEAQARRLMGLAADEIRAGRREPAERIAKLLAAFTRYDLDPMLDAWVEQGRFWPALAFRGAGPAIRDGVLASLDGGTANADHALQALAWIGDRRVEQTFRRYDAAPPSWTAGLHIRPSDYARAAGWELTAGGELGRRELTYQRCLAITEATADAGTAGLRVGEPTDDPCPWCRRPLVNLLQIDLTDPTFTFLQFSGTAIDVRTCEMCTCYGVVHGELDAAGQGRWSAGNKPPKFLPRDPSSWGRMPWSGVAVRLSPRPAHHAADWCLPTTLSQIGGQPAWVQDLAYPNCLRCGLTMLFLAQLDTAAFRGHEGVYYAFLCPTCRTTATTYQQT